MKKWFAGVYAVYGAHNLMVDDDLETVFNSIQHQADEGECAPVGFYELVDGAWVELDVSALAAAREAREEAEYKSYKDRERAKPFRLWLHGPAGSTELVSAHPTRQEAEAAAAEYEGIRSTITTDNRRPVLAQDEGEQ